MNQAALTDAASRLGPKLNSFMGTLEPDERELFEALLALAERVGDESTETLESQGDSLQSRQPYSVNTPSPNEPRITTTQHVLSLLPHMPTREKAP